MSYTETNIGKLVPVSADTETAEKAAKRILDELGQVFDEDYYESNLEYLSFHIGGYDLMERLFGKI